MKNHSQSAPKLVHKLRHSTQQLAHKLKLDASHVKIVTPHSGSSGSAAKATGSHGHTAAESSASTISAWLAQAHRMM